MKGRLGLAAAIATGIVVALAASASAGTLVQISSDPFSNPTSQHRTQVEPDTFAFGSTIVAAMQTGRFFSGGSTDIGWATSRDGGANWTHGFLPGITFYDNLGGSFPRVSDPSVAFDAKHGVW
ncbi:MAG: exo-alpha-sialidase, partial [Chloroflexi bacterium]